MIKIELEKENLVKQLVQENVKIKFYDSMLIAKTKDDHKVKTILRQICNILEKEEL